ncbi:DegT/DnrJ/EryC1/StrS family aminotransferase [Candidatus Gottesmanbacteria bacterium]|nr:DegT/DnrJ/EryC1/StrS family aminotransferase [Candidatus Gottesmanbacteria bacterium]
MKIIPASEPILLGNELKYVTDCIKSTWISHGSYVDLFENKFAKFCGVAHATSVASGTAALHLALVALGIGPGDEVIVPDFTFVSTANVVVYAGATPVLADINMETWNIDPGAIKRSITKKTKAIIVAHLFGHPADMDPILAVAREHDLLVIEDACESHGALYKGKKVGSIGDVGCFSFYGNKVMTTGEGGMVVSGNKGIIDRIAYLKAHAQDQKKQYMHSEIGFNYRLTNLQSAFGLAQLEHIDVVLTAKRKHAALYNTLLKSVRGIVLPPGIEWARNIYWMYSILLPSCSVRKYLMEELARARIETRPFFVPLHRLPMYKKKKSFPNSDDISDRGMSLPSSAKVTEKDIRYICKQIVRILRVV